MNTPKHLEKVEHLVPVLESEGYETEHIFEMSAVEVKSLAVEIQDENVLTLEITRRGRIYYKRAA